MEITRSNESAAICATAARMHNGVKTYGSGDTTVQALDGIDVRSDTLNETNPRRPHSMRISAPDTS